MTPIKLPHDLGIANAVDLKQQLTACLNKPEQILLDGSQIQRIHTASLQILSAFFSSRNQSSLETAWSGTSTALCEATSVSGLSNILKLPDKIMEKTNATPHIDCR